jgi:tryptophanyl-tRNA synthetase
MPKPVILTGIRSNSDLTLGNYLGAILPLIKLQSKHSKDYQINMFVPDLHSFTTPIDHNNLYGNTISNLKIFTAAGLDIHNTGSLIYRQSFVPAHSELTWILDCFVHFGELSRMIQFKEKSASLSSVSAGLFNYPVLMAADILLYDAKYVPVGEDQRQHLELSRDIAIRFNHQFNRDIFVVPEPWDEQLKFADLSSGARIKSLKNPKMKMSKSISDPTGTILLNDDPKTAADKVLGATTDSVGIINFDLVKQPGIANLLQIIALLSGEPLNSTIAKWQGQTSYRQLKETAAQLVEAFLSELQTRIQAVSESDLLAKLQGDEIEVNKIANAKLYQVQQLVGLRN